jgi:hypothetical protein
MHTPPIAQDPKRGQHYADAQGKVWAVDAVTPLGSPHYFLVRLLPATVGRSSPLHLSSAEFGAMTRSGSLIPAMG